MITTASFTSGAENSAQIGNIRLVDGERLVTVMLTSEIGVSWDDGALKLDPGFWSAFDQPEDTDTIPSLESPRPVISTSFRTCSQRLMPGETQSQTSQPTWNIGPVKTGQPGRPTTTR